MKSTNKKMTLSIAIALYMLNLEKEVILMTIDDIIYKNIIVRDNIPENPTSHIDKVIESVCCDSGLTIKMIYSNFVFPRIITFGEKSVLIWDQTYWELFRLYLAYFTDLNATQKKIVLYDNDFVPPKILIPLAYYLAMIVKDKNLALNFAYYYKCKMLERQVIFTDINSDELSQYVEIAKMYVAVHEQTHFRYKNDKIQKALDFKFIEDMLDIAHILFESYDESYCKAEYLKSKSELLEMVNTARSNDDLKEELLCDTYSLNNCISVYRNVWKKKYSEKKIITKCLETIRIVNYYNSILVSLKIFWQNCDCNIDEVNIHRHEMSSRMYLFEVIAATQIIQQDLQDYDDENLWNYNGFEDNYTLENIMHSYFFNEKALEYWKNIFSSDIREKLLDKDIYELLNWR